MGMWDRYDVRDEQRDRAEAWDRNFGSRGGASERDRDYQRDPRDVFTKDLDLPRGRERRPVRDRDRVYETNGTKSQMLATVGAFRVVAGSDLHDGRDDTRKAQRHLTQEGLLRSSPLSSDERAAVLTEHGRDLLEANPIGTRRPLARAPSTSSAQATRTTSAPRSISKSCGCSACLANVEPRTPAADWRRRLAAQTRPLRRCGLARAACSHRVPTKPKSAERGIELRPDFIGRGGRIRTGGPLRPSDPSYDSAHVSATSEP